MTKELGIFDANIKTDVSLEKSPVVELSYKDIDPSKDLTASIAPEFGSNLFKFRLGDLDLIHCDSDLLRARDFTGTFVMWPIPNRLKDKKYSWQGEEYSLAGLKRPQGNNVLVHGLVFDKPWNFDLPIASKNFTRVRTYTEINENHPFFAGFPFKSRISLDYILSTDGMKVVYTIDNQSKQDLPFGFGLHPYFKALSEKSTILISAPANYVMKADSELLPSGRLDNVEGTAFDLRQPQRLNRLNLDHVFTGLEPGKYGSIDYTSEKLKINLETSGDFSHLTIYTPSVTEPFFCMENQTCSTDALNLDKQGFKQESHLLSVAPGQRYSGYIKYQVSHY
ncbi:MAG: aldose 1-epimerase [Microgenomates group bacterium]|jgi:aldose 1-epimerase